MTTINCTLEFANLQQRRDGSGTEFVSVKARAYESEDHRLPDHLKGAQISFIIGLDEDGAEDETETQAERRETLNAFAYQALAVTEIRNGKRVYGVDRRRVQLVATQVKEARHFTDRKGNAQVEYPIRVDWTCGFTTAEPPLPLADPDESPLADLLQAGQALRRASKPAVDPDSVEGRTAAVRAAWDARVKRAKSKGASAEAKELIERTLDIDLDETLRIERAGMALLDHIDQLAAEKHAAADEGAEDFAG